MHKKVVQFETIEAVRNHIQGLGADMTLHVARRQLGGDGAAGSGARVAELRLTPQEQLQVGLVETVGRLRPGLFAAWTATADSEQRASGGRATDGWYDQLDVHLMRLRVTPPRPSTLGARLAEPLHGLSDAYLGGAGRLWVRVHLERSGVTHESEAVPWDGKAGVVPLQLLKSIPIHPLGDTMRLTAHCRSASSLLLSRELGGAALGASAREMGEAREVEANLRLSSASHEEVGRLQLSARYTTTSSIGRRHAATRAAALVRGFLGRRLVERKLAYVVHLQCRWRAKQALRLMSQLRREKGASTRIQEWWLRGQRNKKLLISGMLELDAFEATLLQARRRRDQFLL